MSDLDRLKLKRAQRRTPEQKRSDEARRVQPLMKALKAAHSALNADSLAPEDLAVQRRSMELLGQLAAPKLGMSWEPFDLSGTPAAWVRPERGHDRRHVVLYCHGGGYTCGNLGYSRALASKLAHTTGYEVLSFEYRLAPEHPYPAALEDALKAWDSLMYQGYGAKDVLVAGDSAGGNLALALTLALKNAGRLLPRALLLMSPWTDMTASGRSYTERAELDPTITLDYIKAVRGAYAAGHDLADPMLSPLFGDLRGFPPVLIQAGDHEMLLSDSIRLRDRLVAAGVPCRLEVWKEMWHVFQIYPIRTAGEAMESLGRFLLEIL